MSDQKLYLAEYAKCFAWEDIRRPQLERIWNLRPDLHGIELTTAEWEKFCRPLIDELVGP